MRVGVRSHPTRPPAMRVWPSYWILPSAATTTRSRTALTAGPASPLSSRFPTIGHARRCAASPCATTAGANTRIPAIGASTRSPSLARPAALGSGDTAGRTSPRRKMPLKSACRCCGRGRSWRSRVWAASNWPAMPATARRWPGSGPESAVTGSRSLSWFQTSRGYGGCASRRIWSSTPYRAANAPSY